MVYKSQLKIDFLKNLNKFHPSYETIEGNRRNASGHWPEKILVKFPRHRQQTKKINKWDWLHKVNMPLMTEETTTRVKRQLENGRKSFSNI